MKNCGEQELIYFYASRFTEVARTVFIAHNVDGRLSSEKHFLFNSRSVEFDNKQQIKRQTVSITLTSTLNRADPAA